MQRHVRVRHEPAALPAITAALEGLNMGARLLEGTTQAHDAIPAPRIPWKRLAVAGGFAALSEILELIQHWGARPFGLDMASWSVGGWPVLTLLPLCCALIAILLSGLTTYRKGWLAVSNLDLNINALMSVAVTGAVLIGQFPEAAMVMVLFNVSEAIEAKALDRARNAIKDLLALDKTGTLTHGKPRQTDCLCTGQEDEAAVRSLAASLAARSDHPVSGAIAQAALADHIPLQDVDDFTALPGQGVSGIMAGRRWYLGNRALAASLGRYPAALDERISRLEQQGKTVVALVGDDGIRALFAVADTLKASSLEAVRELKALGVTTVMLTGDNEHTAAAIARQVGVDSFKAGLLPADKLAVIEELEARGHKVGMVGDGINDAPALARADVGFAMAGNGTDTAIETADVALMDDDLRKIPRFIRLSRATFAILVQNITLALGVKALFFALTFTGHATMWMAVFADVGTALLVVANGLRAMRQ